RQRGRERIDSDGTAAVTHRYRREIAPVHRIEPGGIDFEFAKRTIRRLAVHRLRAVDMRKVTHAPQQSSGDARRAAGAACDLVGAVNRHRQAEYARAAIDDLLQLLFGIKIESHRNAEAVA